MPLHNDYPPASCRTGHRLSRCMVGGALLALCGAGALGQVSEAQIVANRLEMANDKLKTCLQRHYDPGHDDMAQYRLGDELVTACRIEWEASKSACAEQSGKTQGFCDAQTKMMLLGFVPMH